MLPAAEVPAAGDFGKDRLPAAKVNSRTTDYPQSMPFCLAQIWGTPAAMEHWIYSGVAR